MASYKMDESQVVEDLWARYIYMRDQGHYDFVTKALKCEEFFCGLQWSGDDLARLKAVRRPALTINKIISTVSAILGEQIDNRTEIAYRARGGGANDDVADALTKVMMQISDNNMLPWVRSDVYADGIITGRGFYDVRLDFNDNLMGEVRVTRLNPKQVLIDPDAETYDVSGWGDVVTSTWLSADDIAVMYSKDAADDLRGLSNSIDPFAYDVLDTERDRFGSPPGNTYWANAESMRGMGRLIRVVERQWRKLDRVEHFVDLVTGDSRMIPTDWKRDKISHYMSINPNIGVMKKLVKRVRWTVGAGNRVLHDDWSPYDDFTIVPFFPHFRSGRTVGLVENLLSPQEYLNKIRSQELHVVNTTANSGWIVPEGSLSGSFTLQDLEERGAETGLVIPTTSKESGLEKIQPNQVPTGLDRLSHKADDDFKLISGMSDSMMGMAREDVSGKAIQQNNARGSANLAKVLDNMMRTDTMMAKRVLSLVQDFYIEERLIQVTKGPFGGTEQVAVNQQTPEGKIVNDLTLGEYDVIVTSQPQRDTFEDSQFEQLVSLRKDLGIAIPDEFLVQNSRAMDKTRIVQALNAQKNSPEQQQDAQLTMRAKVANVSKLEAETKQKDADAKLRLARAHKEINEQLAGPPDEAAQAQIEDKKNMLEHQREMDQMQQKFALEREQLRQKQALELEKHRSEMQMKQEAHQQDISLKEDAALWQRAQDMTAPTPTQGNENGTSQAAAPAGAG